MKGTSKLQSYPIYYLKHSEKEPLPSPGSRASGAADKRSPSRYDHSASKKKAIHPAAYDAGSKISKETIS